MLKNKRLISIIATLAFCLTFLAPALIAPAPAVAADMYQVVKTASVKPSNVAQDTGAVVKVVIPDIAIAGGSRLTVSLPSEWTVPGNVVRDTVVGKANQFSLVGAAVADNKDDTMLALADLGGIVGSTINVAPNKAFDIQLAAAPTDSGANKYFYLVFNGINLNNMTGDMNITFIAPSGSVFTNGVVNIGQSSRSGATMATIKKVNSLTVPGGNLDIITIGELNAGTITNGGNITFKILTKGYEFDKVLLDAGATAMAAYGWDFADGTVPGGGPVPVNSEMINTTAAANSSLSLNCKELTYIVKHANTSEPGRISFANLPVLVDETVAKPGDVLKIKISGADTTEATLEVAKFVDYGLSLEADTSKDLVAGHADQTVGSFKIFESSQGSLIPNRTIKISLPTGVRWNSTAAPDVLNNSDIVGLSAVLNADNDVLTVQCTGASNNTGAELEFDDYTVDIAPDFSGVLEAKISGSAGISGTVKLGDVKPAVTISAENVKNVNLGQANQALGDITLTESVAEGILDTDLANNPSELVLWLDEGYRWSKTPTVKVVEGDLDIDELGVKADGRVLTIPIDGTSATASKIVISDAYVDAFRTAPEGAIFLSLVSYADGNTACLEAAAPISWRDKSGPKAQVGACVTPAATTGRNACFYIGSNIMNVNGANIIMDASPYIKAGRTYVPVRYLGDALGATTSWDEATRTVTVTKDDKTVVLVIGSKTAQVNGADVAMDVAPEIVNGRTMLPARYVAEGLGYQVGWNAALQQVVIQ